MHTAWTLEAKMHAPWPSQTTLKGNARTRKMLYDKAVTDSIRHFKETDAKQERCDAIAAIALKSVTDKNPPGVKWVSTVDSPNRVKDRIKSENMKGTTKRAIKRQS